MATQLFFQDLASTLTAGELDVHHAGVQMTGWANVANGDYCMMPLKTARGGGVVSQVTNTVAGTHAGISVLDTGRGIIFMSDPLAADVTISGTITLNLRAAENNMSANAAINARGYRWNAQSPGSDPLGTSFFNTTRTTELGTSEAAANFTVTPTSTDFQKGDRILVIVYADDAGTMASGFTFTFWYNGTTGGASGDSFITFTEDFSFVTATPAGTQMFFTDVASDVSQGVVEKELDFSRGAGVVSKDAPLVAGWKAPDPFEDGGSDIYWYSPPLQAFTLSGRVRLNLRFSSTGSSGSQFGNGLRAQIARVDSDGSNPTVWAEACWYSHLVFGDLASSTENPCRMELCGDDLAFTDGQRLRLIVYSDDACDQPAVGAPAGTAGRFYYNGTSAAASGDSWIQLTESVSEFAQAFSPPFPQQGRDRDRYGLAQRLQALGPRWKRHHGILVPETLPIGEAELALAG